ncbi:MAG: PBP1A family penicillin-binding protein [Pseudomonadota bacterium]
MVRSIMIFFGTMFSAFTLAGVVGALGFAAVILVFGEGLPDHKRLSTYEPPVISRIYSTDGVIVDEFAEERRLFTPADEIPEIVKHAFISAEDKNFYQHSGYDPMGIAAAIYEAAQGGDLRGASTITQQVMKNFLLDGSRTIERKVKEIILAARLERTLSKEEILELYLNEIFLGQNSYGVTAAAETYYNKSLEELSVAEAAYLAALPQRPGALHPVRDREAAIWRRNFVLREMGENGYLSADDVAKYQAEDLITVQSGDIVSARSERADRDYFTDEIRRQLSGNFGEEEFFTGGLKIRASMDPELQKIAASALRSGLEKYDRGRSPWLGAKNKLDLSLLSDEQAWRDAMADTVLVRDVPGWTPAVVLSVTPQLAEIGIEGQPLSGQVIEFARENQWAKNRELEDGSIVRLRSMEDMVEIGDVVYVVAITQEDGTLTGEWELRQVPKLQGAFVAMDVETGRVLAMQGGFSYQDTVFNRATQALRQPGSSIKPFVYATALDNGFSPATIVVDAPIEVNTPEGVWRPKNSSNRFYGPAPMRIGIEQSRNLMTVRLAQEVGMDVIADTARRFGVYDNMQPFLSGALGAQETTLFKMVTAYAMFANGGERVEPTLVDRVQDRYGSSIYKHDRRQCVNCDVETLEAGFGPRVQSNRVRVMDQFTAYQLTSMMRGVVQRGTATSVRVNAPVAGKTGTTNEAKDVWFIGFTPRIVAGCYMGFDQPEPLGRGAFGGTLCAPVFTEFMTKAVEKYGAGEFERPEGGRFLKFDRYSGARLPNDAQGPEVIAEYFRLGEEPYVGAIGLIVDGGFAMGEDLLLYDGTVREETTIERDDGTTTVVPGNASFGTINSGGLY